MRADEDRRRNQENEARRGEGETKRETGNGAIEVTKEFSLEMAHALEGHDGACSRIHGHSYRLWVTVAGRPVTDRDSPKQGMVVDFGDLKRIVGEQIVARFDHAFVVRRTEANSELVDALAAHYRGVRIVDWQPTSENLVNHFAELLMPHLGPGVRLRALRLSETATSFAELKLPLQEVL